MRPHCGHGNTRGPELSRSYRASKSRLGIATGADGSDKRCEQGSSPLGQGHCGWRQHALLMIASFLLGVFPSQALAAPTAEQMTISLPALGPVPTGAIDAPVIYIYRQDLISPSLSPLRIGRSLVCSYVYHNGYSPHVYHNGYILPGYMLLPFYHCLYCSGFVNYCLPYFLPTVPPTRPAARSPPPWFVPAEQLAASWWPVGLSCRLPIHRADRLGHCGRLGQLSSLPPWYRIQGTGGCDLSGSTHQAAAGQRQMLIQPPPTKCCMPLRGAALSRRGWENNSYPANHPCQPVAQQLDLGADNPTDRLVLPPPCCAPLVQGRNARHFFPRSLQGENARLFFPRRF